MKANETSSAAVARSVDSRIALALASLRIVTALLMLGHPLQKFAGFPVVSQRGLADLLSLGGVAGVIEIVTGLLLLIGLFTRVAAFVLSGTMAAAYFIGHAPRGWFPIQNDGELAIMFCFTLLLISAAGPGAFSIDRRHVQ